jgi:hypothetical protein
MTVQSRFALSIAALLLAGGTLRGAAKPHADRAAENRTWTNDDLERLSRIPGLISIVGQATNEDAQDVGAPAPQLTTEEPAWFAAQAAVLNARLETEQANFRDFIQALDDARELNTTTGGLNFAEDNIGITPEATIDILQNQVRETQSELDALEDLARHNGIPPGILRDQGQGLPAETAVTAAEQSQREMSARGGDL